MEYSLYLKLSYYIRTDTVACYVTVITTRKGIKSIDMKKESVYKNDRESIFLTFNYTDTLESVYCIDPDNIKHIHGYVKNKNEELVIGHCNQKAISYN